MQALQINQYGQPLALNAVAQPVPTGGETLVRVTACGMCHSDLHIHAGGFNLGGGQTQPIAGSHALPHTLGHEIEGILEAAGPDASLPAGVRLGSRVAVYPWIGCGNCAACAADHETLCLAPRQLGIHAPGGFATHVLVPAGRYLLGCDGIEPGRAGLMMCSGLTAYGALAKTPADAALLLLGAGGVGLTAIHIARMLGRPAPVVADTSAAARDAALAAGAAAVLDPAEPGALEAALALSGGGFAAAIDFVGATATTGFAVQSLAKGGTLVVVGLFGGTLSLPILLFPVRQLRVLGSMTGTLAEAHALLDLVRARGAPPIPLHPHALRDGEAARAALAVGSVHGRIVLTP